MNTDSVIRMDEEPAQPLVDWFPPAGPLRALSLPLAVAASAVAVGALAYAGFALARSLHDSLDR